MKPIATNFSADILPFDNYALRILVVAALAIIPSIARAELFDRGGGLIYDDILDVTWLQDANFAQTSGFDADGQMTAAEAETWAANLTYYDLVRDVTYDDWRLPNATDIGNDGATYSNYYQGVDYGYNITTPSELSHMFYSNLSNTAAYTTSGFTTNCDNNPPTYCLTNTGPFLNLQADRYWTNQQYGLDVGKRFIFYFNLGAQQHTDKGNVEYAWAVRDGDVGSVGPIVDQENDPPINGQTACQLTVGTSGSAEPPGFAQIFTVGIEGTLAAVDFQISRRSAYAGNELRLQIRNVDNVTQQPAAILGEVTVPVTGLQLFPNTPEFIRFDVSALGIAVSPGQKLAIAWTRDPISEPSEKRLVVQCSNGTVGDPDGLYLGGGPFYSPDGGATWNDIPFQSWTDFLFRTLVTPTPTGPAADAGDDQSEDEGSQVTLNGSGSTGAVNYAGSQIAGPSVTLSDFTLVNPTFFTPFVPSNTTLTLQLIVDDGAGNFSDPDTIDVTVVDVNSAPISDAGDDGTIKEGAVATLDGSNSFDPEGDSPLGYVWAQTSGPVVTLSPSNNAVSPTFTAPVGVGNVLSFELVVDDNKEVSAVDEVSVTVVENTAPVADAGPDQTVDEGTLVSLNGTASNDADGGDTLSFDWTETIALDDNTLVTPSFTAPMANPGGSILDFSLVVNDDDSINPKFSAPDQVSITVRNINDPPSCNLARAACPESKIKNNDGCTLWPPNHKLIDVTIEGVMDADSTYNDVTLTVTGVTQDEATNGTGDGDSSPDGVLQSDSVLLRAERAGGGNGRVYEVSFTADDGFESCSGSVTVGVPHNRKGSAIDDGQAYDSTLP